jgi:hypothetical protein
LLTGTTRKEKKELWGRNPRRLGGGWGGSAREELAVGKGKFSVKGELNEEIAD